MASDESVTPRARSAACQRGSAFTAASQARNSSVNIGGCTPSTWVQLTTSPRVSDTTASYVSRADAVAQHRERLAVPLLPGRPTTSTSAFGGSRSSTKTKRVLGGSAALGAQDERGAGHLVGGERLERVRRRGEGLEVGRAGGRRHRWLQAVGVVLRHRTLRTARLGGGALP